MRTAVLTAIVDRLSVILVNNGFETDAGAAIVLGETPQLGPADPHEALGVVIGDEVPSSQAPAAIMVATAVQIHGVSKVTAGDPFHPLEAVLADIKRAVERPDRTLGGLVREMRRGETTIHPREPGATTAGLSIAYVVTWKDDWGATVAPTP